MVSKQRNARQGDYDQLKQTHGQKQSGIKYHVTNNQINK